MYLDAICNNEMLIALYKAFLAPLLGKRRAIAVIIFLYAKGGVSMLVSGRRGKRECVGRLRGRLLVRLRGRLRKIL